MPIIPATYKPPFLFKNGHINTIYPVFFRKQSPVAFSRTRMETPDDDFFDVDYLRCGNRKIVILCHGLEGSSQSQYIQGTSRLLHAHGFDVAAMNYRGCSGEMNRKVYSYHSGSTDDLHLLVQSLIHEYDELVMVGFSLGGNMVLKYSCDQLYPLDRKIKAVIAISVPVDLYAGALEFLKLSNRHYTINFLNSLRAKIKLKHAQFPDEINLDDLSKVNSILDFDDYFTGPLNGFKNAQDYYAKCHSKQFLNNCDRPTLIINAKDDPFLPEPCIDEAVNSEFLHLCLPEHGGHLGFVNLGVEHYWYERQILNFIKMTEGKNT